ncbi:hypothetical protein ABZW30_44805 [Kitasatospora sp. NPDC004669]|uniref:hypothetical protein n=1 Tax=Kitasatospora sp. NPDC004669 TaxID=3154555 RepID=UPI0033ADE533
MHDHIPPLAMKVHQFLGWVGAGRPLTGTGELRIADALELVGLLETGDDPTAGGHLRGLRSSRDLPGLRTLRDIAVEAGLLRTVRGRLVPVKKHAHMAATPLGVCDLLVRNVHETAPLLLSPDSEQPGLGAVVLQTLWASLATQEVSALPVHDLHAALWAAVADNIDPGNLYPPGTTIDQAKAELAERADLVLSAYESLGLMVITHDRGTVETTARGRQEAERRTARLATAR